MRLNRLPFVGLVALSIAAAPLALFSGLCWFERLGNGSSSGGGGGGSRQFITIGTAPDGGVFSLVGNAISSVVDGNKGEQYWVITPEGTKGPKRTSAD